MYGATYTEGKIKYTVIGQEGNNVAEIRYWAIKLFLIFEQIY